jgi:hypothetical protein
MGEEQIDVIEKEIIETPEIKSGYQAILLIIKGFGFFLTNWKYKTLAVVALLIALLMVAYNNLETIVSVYKNITSVGSK